MNTDLLTYDETELASALSALPVAARTAFAGSCACRIAIAAASRGADMSLALQAIEQLRDFAEGATMRNGDEMEAELIASIQDEDEAPDFEASLVEDALAAAAYGFRCAASGGAMNAVWASRRAYDAVDRYAGLRQNVTAFTEGVEAAILSHPLVQSELRRQRRDVVDLGRMRGDPKEFATLIDRAGQEPLLS
jgi:hypothetical protein